jgi:hypothetical protein
MSVYLWQRAFLELQNGARASEVAQRRRGLSTSYRRKIKLVVGKDH